jgi:hypothetical protein
MNSFWFRMKRSSSRNIRKFQKIKKMIFKIIFFIFYLTSHKI